MARTLAAALLLALYGNAFSLLHARLSGRPRTALAWSGPLALLATVVGWHRFAERRPLGSLGLHRNRLGHGLAWGAAAGTALAVVPVLWFRYAVFSGLFRLSRVPGTPAAGRPLGQRGRARPPVVADELRVSMPAFLLRVFVVTPLLVALAEEVTFRGFLQSKFRRALPGSAPAAIALSSLSFALWHVTVNVHTLHRTNVLAAGLCSLPLALAGGLLGVFGGGLVFGALYQATGGLTAPLMAHWLVDALMLAALYDPPRRCATSAPVAGPACAAGI